MCKNITTLEISFMWWIQFWQILLCSVISVIFDFIIHCWTFSEQSKEMFETKHIKIDEFYE